MGNNAPNVKKGDQTEHGLCDSFYNFKSISLNHYKIIISETILDKSERRFCNNVG